MKAKKQSKLDALLVKGQRERQWRVDLVAQITAYGTAVRDLRINVAQLTTENEMLSDALNQLAEDLRLSRAAVRKEPIEVTPKPLPEAPRRGRPKGSKGKKGKE